MRSRIVGVGEAEPRQTLVSGRLVLVLFLAQVLAVSKPLLRLTHNAGDAYSIVVDTDKAEKITAAYISDLKGRMVSKLAPKSQTAGCSEYIWNGRGTESVCKGAGIYIINIRTTHRKASQRISIR